MVLFNHNYINVSLDQHIYIYSRELYKTGTFFSYFNPNTCMHMACRYKFTTNFCHGEGWKSQLGWLQMWELYFLWCSDLLMPIPWKASGHRAFSLLEGRTSHAPLWEPHLTNIFCQVTHSRTGTVLKLLFVTVKAPLLYSTLTWSY